MGQEELKQQFLAAYDAYANAIFRFCLAKVSDRERAQDFTQETYMRYWQTLQKGEHIQNERAYLYTLARNIITDWYRRKKESSLDVLTDAGFDFSDSAEHEITQKAEVREALAVIRTLDEESQEVLLLRFVEGHTPREIAKMLKTNPNVISVRIHRAIKKVQEQMRTKDDHEK